MAKLAGLPSKVAFVFNALLLMPPSPFISEPVPERVTTAPQGVPLMG